jgi:hypothetical protein
LVPGWCLGNSTALVPMTTVASALPVHSGGSHAERLIILKCFHITFPTALRGLCTSPPIGAISLEILQHHRLIPEVMRQDVIHHALRLVTIWRGDTCCRLPGWKARERDGHVVPAWGKTEGRVRSCGLSRNWRGAGRHGITGGGKVGDVIAVVISILLCASGNGSGRVMARGPDTRHVDMRGQRRCWRAA